MNLNNDYGRELKRERERERERENFVHFWVAVRYT